MWTPRGPWAIVLAGGDGTRLRDFAREVLHDTRPKQYLPLVGPCSLLRQTLDRVGLVVPRAQTVVVSVARQAPLVAAELPEGRGPTVLWQPDYRGTAAGILLPVHWVWARDPEATVAVFPSDHFVREDAPFMAHVAELAAFAARHPDRVVLLGAPPTHPDTEYGWIEPGEMLAATTAGPIRTVWRFLEKPGPDLAARCLAQHWLWNTFVIVARASAVIDLGRALLPALHARLVAAGPFMGSHREGWAIEQALAGVPTQDFSRVILAATPQGLAVSTLPDVTWSDLGTPRRLLDLLERLGTRPPWARPRGVTRMEPPPSGTLIVQVRFLAGADVCLWSWELVEPATGHVVESGWESAWLAYESPEQARQAGLQRLRDRGPESPRMPRLAPPSPARPDPRIQGAPA